MVGGYGVPDGGEEGAAVGAGQGGEQAFRPAHIGDGLAAEQLFEAGAEECDGESSVGRDVELEQGAGGVGGEGAEALLAEL